VLIKLGIENRFEPTILNDRDQFTTVFHRQQKQLKKDFNDYFNSFGGHLCMPRSKYFTKLIRHGVPM
jgi:hypothetical protein